MSTWIHPKSTPVIATNLVTNLKTTFPSVTSCAKHLGAGQGNISYALDKSNRSIKGHRITTA